MNGFTRWWRTVGVLVGLELRQRTRATRWRVLLGLFFLVVSAVVLGLMWFITTSSPDNGWQTFTENLYFIVLGFVGFLGLVISPTMTATSINGDRKDATLAVVQATPVSGLQLAIGKLLGAWLASCALLAVASPYLIWGIAVVEYPLAYSVLGVLAVSLIFLSYCGIGLGFSALLSRPIGSAAVTQLAVLFLLVGLPLITVLLVPATESRVTAMRPEYTYIDDDTSVCTLKPESVTVTHTERIWWLTSPNPVVILADAAAQRDYGRDADRGSRPGRYVDYTNSDEHAARRPSPSGLAAIADLVAETRVPPNANQDSTCPRRSSSGLRIDGDVVYGGSETSRDRERYLGHSWYWGLLANLALGGIGLAFAARRLRVPASRLPRGVRIA
ncbi:ABC transporter permease [Tsukamurella sputi]|uniref:ABC transporter permease n=1 Tax=Tsukamurella sputi TaxID=2591848 RepID=A0A5C5RMV6_9ACTN|nr:ABC transporter permease [Tsukamurella sputi]